MNSQFKKGVLDLIVMMIVDQGDIYGYELVKKVSEVIDVNEGTIYPLLKRLTRDQYFETYLKESTEGPPRKYYRMTDKGRLALSLLKKDWFKFISKVSQFITGDPHDD